MKGMSKFVTLDSLVITNKKSNSQSFVARQSMLLQVTLLIEMIMRKSYIGPEVDIWSLGVLIFVMVTGTLPFSDPKLSRMMTLVASAKYTIPSFISLSGQDLIKTILQVNPHMRPTLKGIRDHEWTNVDYEHKVLFRESGYLPNSVKLDRSTIELLEKHKFTQQWVHQYCELRIPGRVKAAVYLHKQSQKIPTTELAPRTQTPVIPKVLKYQPKLEPEESNLLANIRQKIATDSNLLNQIEESVIAIFEHDEDQQSLQRQMLENLICNQGRIFYVDEDYPELFYGALPLEPPEMFDNVGFDEDDELLKCLESISTIEMKFSALTMTTKQGPNQTCFKLLNGYEYDWLIKCFDQIIAQVILYQDYFDESISYRSSNDSTTECKNDERVNGTVVESTRLDWNVFPTTQCSGTNSW